MGTAFILLLIISKSTSLTGHYGNHSEGDIAHNPNEVRQSGVLRGFLSDRKFRWGHTIQYTIGTELLANTSLIEGCLTWISERSCLKFIRGNVGDRIKFTSFGDNLNSGDGCWSYLGRQGFEQAINLGEGCLSRHTVFHETFHALGKVHEQSRPDRDEHIEVLLDNVKKDKKDNFDINPDIDTAGTRYDLWSIMHNGPTKFGINGTETIRVRNNPDAEFGMTEEPTWSDMFELNHAYRCPPLCPDPTSNICPREMVFVHSKLGRSHKFCRYDQCRGFSADLSRVAIGEIGTGGRCRDSDWNRTQYEFCCSFEQYFTHLNGTQKEGVNFPRCSVMNHTRTDIPQK